MKAHWEYLKTVLRHKWFVFLACRKLGLPLWRGVVHDLSKFSRTEWGAYVRQFYNPDGSKKPPLRDKTGAYDPSAQPVEFQRAWLNHQRNKHHWQAWISFGDSGNLSALPMPTTYLKEMVADWMGAGMAYAGKADPVGWYRANGDKMLFHPESRHQLEVYLEGLQAKGIIP